MRTFLINRAIIVKPEAESQDVSFLLRVLHPQPEPKPVPGAKTPIYSMMTNTVCFRCPVSWASERKREQQRVEQTGLRAAAILLQFQETQQERKRNLEKPTGAIIERRHTLRRSTLLSGEPHIGTPCFFRLAGNDESLAFFLQDVSWVRVETTWRFSRLRSFVHTSIEAIVHKLYLNFVSAPSQTSAILVIAKRVNLETRNYSWNLCE